MFDVRKIVVVILIAILFAVFVFSSIEAVYPSPDYDDYCDDRIPKALGNTECPVLEPPRDFYESCDGDVDFEYDSNGCATSYFCNSCFEEYDAVRDEHQRVVFYIAAILSLIAIFVALNLPVSKKNRVHEWVGTGLLLGGAFVLLFGTVQGFESLDRITRPIVMLAELVLVIYLAYKKLN